MTHPMPDQDTTPEPPKRMTTAEAAKMAQEAAQNASAALRVAQGADDMVAAVSEQVTDLGQRVRDRETAHAELRDEIMQRLAGVGPTSADPSAGLVDADGKPVVTRDQVDSRIHEALQPLHDEVHELRRKGTLTPESKGSLSGVLARLEDAERKLMPLDVGALTEQVAAALHPTLTGFRNRLTAVEEVAKTLDGDPVAHTLAEDALADQLETMVDRKLAAMFEAAGLTPARLASLTREVDDLRQHVETHGTRVTRYVTDQVANELERRQVHVQGDAAPASGGTGAARKVLQLMKLVTHIGKERQADMGTGGKFKFRGIDEAMDAVGHAMREVGVILSTEVLKDETSTVPVTKKGDGRNGPYESTILWTTTKTTMRYIFVDPEDGSTHTIEMVGEGRDASDKSTSKAGSMAFKYALLQALCIPVTGMDDSDAAPPQIMENEGSTRPQQQAPAQQQAQAAPDRTEEQKAQRAGEALGAIRNVYRVEGGPQAQYNRLVQIMNQVKREGLLDFAIEGSTLNQHGEAAMRTLQAPPPPDDARASTEPPEPPEDYR